MKNITGIILSGGKSQRMGTDKAFISYKGKLLIEHSINLLKPVCSEILISANSEEYNSFGYEVVVDEVKDCGPIGGIYSALKKSSNSLNLLLSCDTPFINIELINRLIANAENCDCVFPVHNGKKEPLVSIFNKNRLDVISKQLKSGNFKMQNLLEKLNCITIEVDDLVKKNLRMFANFNTPEDFFD